MSCARTATAIAPLCGGNLKFVVRARQGIRTPTTCLEGTGAAVTPASRDGSKYTHFEITDGFRERIVIRVSSREPTEHAELVNYKGNVHTKPVQVLTYLRSDTHNRFGH